MKKILLILLLSLSMQSFVTETINVTTGNITISDGNDGHTMINTGAACTFTLGATTTNFVVTVINQGTGNITFGTAITVSPGVTITTLPAAMAEIRPTGIGNKIKLHRDSGGVWRAI